MTRHHNDGLTKRCDCPRRQWAKCRHAWHLVFNHRGTRYRFSLDRHLGRPVNGKTDAKAAADQIRAAIRAGEFQDGVSVAQMTLGQLLALYYERYISRERPRTAVFEVGQQEAYVGPALEVGDPGEIHVDRGDVVAGAREPAGVAARSAREVVHRDDVSVEEHEIRSR